MESSSSTRRIVEVSAMARNARYGRGVPYTGRAMAPPRRALADARAPPPRLRRAARSTRGWCAERGCSSRCRCCSPPSRSAGRSRCRRRRCRRHSTARPPQQLARELAGDYPDRSPGSPGALGAAQWVSRPASALRLRRRRTDTLHGARFPGRGEVELHERRRGRAGRLAARDRVMAHRDNNGDGPGANDNASGTAALVELARAYAPVTAARRCAGAPGSHARLRLDRRRRVRRARRRAVRGELALPRPTRSRSSASTRSPAAAPPRLADRRRHRRARPRPALVRTAATRVLEQTGEEPAHASCAAAAARPRLSVHARRAGRLRRPRHRLRSRCTTAGERPRAARSGTRASTTERLGRARARRAEPGRLARRRPRARRRGRRATSTSAAASSAAGRSSSSCSRRCCRSSSARSTSSRAAAVAGSRSAPAVRSLRGRLFFWAYAGRARASAPRARRSSRTVEPRPAAARRRGAATRRRPSCVGVVLALLLAGWLVGRERLIPRRPATLEEKLAGYTVALLALGLIALLVVATNPFALDLPPAVAVRLALAAPGARARPVARARAARARLRRAAAPRALVRDAVRPRRSTHRGTCSRSSASATSRWLAVAARRSPGRRRARSSPRSRSAATRRILTSVTRQATVAEAARIGSAAGAGRRVAGEQRGGGGSDAQARAASLGTLMIVAGVGALAWAITIWQWQDPFTAAMQELDQRKLAADVRAAGRPRRAARRQDARRRRRARPCAWSSPRRAGVAEALHRGRRDRAPADPAHRRGRDHRQRHRRRTRSSAGPAATSARRCRARASSSTSPATARPTARRSRTSTGIEKGDPSSSSFRTGRSSTW